MEEKYLKYSRGDVMFRLMRLGWWVIYLGILVILGIIAMKIVDKPKSINADNLAHPEQVPVDKEPYYDSQKP